MNVRKIMISAAFLLPLASWAGEEKAAVEKPYISATQTAKMTAEVTSINHETREVTLLGADGTSQSLTVSEEARNLGQVNAGDMLQIEVLQNLTIEVMADDGSELGSGSMTAAGRAAEGDMPGMAAMDTTITMARVEDINIEANTFKLKFQDDSIEEYVARDPENLKKSEVGDLVVITQTEALAITVEKTNAE